MLADEKAYALVLEDDDLEGLPDFARAAARAAAQERGPPANTPSRWRGRRARASCNSSSSRDLREKMFQAWIRRGENGAPTDNRAIIAEMVGFGAPSGRRCSFFDLRRLPARRSDGQDAASRRGLLDEVWGGRAGRPKSNAMPCRR